MPRLSRFASGSPGAWRTLLGGGSCTRSVLLNITDMNDLIRRAEQVDYWLRKSTEHPLFTELLDALKEQRSKQACDTLASMQYSLDAEPWLTLFALADWYRDQGNDILADGYAWLANQRKTPVLDRAKGGYIWWHAGMALAASDGILNAVLMHCLPAELKKVRPEDPAVFCYFLTAAEAYHAAATAIGQSTHGIRPFPCSHCDGTGHDPDGIVCERCAGSKIDPQWLKEHQRTNQSQGD